MRYSLKSILFISVWAISLFNSVLAQKKEMAAAKELENGGRFSMALQLYKKAEAKDKYLAPEERVELYKSIIYCNTKLSNPKATEKYFEKIKDEEALTDSLAIKYSEVLRTLGKFPDAEKEYLAVANKQNDARLKANMLATLDWFKKYRNNIQPYKIARTNIKTDGLSMGVEEYKNGVIIGMPKKEEEQVFYNLGFSEKKDSIHFSEPVLLSKNLTSKFYEGYPSYDAKNKILYFTSNSLSKTKVKQGGKKDKGNINRLKIYKSVWVDGDWSEKEELPFNSMEYDCLHPSISEDGNTLYFTSNKKGGIGGYDIYKVTKQGDKWSEPFNLGSLVNSIGDEMTPKIVNDVLYFSSRGFFGFGGSDVFKVNLKDKEAKIENLGKPVNSEKDDFAFIINKEDRGYFSTNRDSKKAEDLIYSFVYYPVNIVTDAENGERVEDIDVTILAKVDGEWKEVHKQSTNKKGEWHFDFKDDVDYKVLFDNSYRNSKEIILPASGDRNKQLKELQNVDLQRVFIDGYVIDEETKKGIEGVKEVLFEENENGEFEEIDSTWTDKDGYWRFDVEKNKVYEVEIQRVDYKLEKIKIEPIGDGEPHRKSYVSELKIIRNQDDEKVLDAENIFFEVNSATITKDSYKVLDQVIGYLKAHPYSKLEIAAYTDCTGDDALNMALSQRRAEACAKYVIKGIGGKAFRVRSKGYGETKPLNPCAEQEANPEIAAKNRRVEFKLVK